MIPKSNPFAVIENATQHQAPRKNPKAGDLPMAQSAIAKMAAASRTANKNQQKSTSKTSNSSDAFVHWQKHSFDLIQSMIDKVDTEGPLQSSRIT
jgi:soluble cytochrome b562